MIYESLRLQLVASVLYIILLYNIRRSFTIPVIEKNIHKNSAIHQIQSVTRSEYETKHTMARSLRTQETQSPG